MPLLIERESLKALLSELPPTDLRTVLALAANMGEDQQLAVSIKAMGATLGLTPHTIRDSIRRLEASGLLLVKKRGRGPNTKTSLAVSPVVACDPSILHGFEAGFDKVQEVSRAVYRLVKRSSLKEV